MNWCISTASYVIGIVLDIWHAYSFNGWSVVTFKKELTQNPKKTHQFLVTTNCSQNGIAAIEILKRLIITLSKGGMCFNWQLRAYGAWVWHLGTWADAMPKKTTSSFNMDPRNYTRCMSISLGDPESFSCVLI